jgi:hypothetical protein
MSVSFMGQREALDLLYGVHCSKLEVESNLDGIE